MSREGMVPLQQTASDPAALLLEAPRSVSVRFKLMLLGSWHMQAQNKISCLQAGVHRRDALGTF